MARSISPLALRIAVSGGRQGQNEVRQFASSFDVVTQKGKEAANSAREAFMAGRETRVIAQNYDAGGEAAGGATRKIAGMVREIAASRREAISFGKDFRDVGKDVSNVFSHVQKLHGIVQALRSGSPVKLFDAAVPDAVKKKIGGGMIAGGVGLGALLGTTIGPAMEKESRQSAIEAFTKSKKASSQIYNIADETAGASAFGLDEVVVSAKTLTKDQQFSKRYLQATDDLAAANVDEGASPQDVARLLGRLKAGDFGEGFERARDFGISRTMLEEKGLKFSDSNEYEDKTPEGAKKAVEAVVAIIEERFGGLSEKLALTTTQGAVTNLGDAFNRARTVIGQELIPAINFGANMLQTLVTWFVALPEPIHKIIAYTSAFTAGLMILAGAYIYARVTMSGLIFAFKILTFQIPIVNKSLLQLAWGLLTRLVPSLAVANGLTLTMGLTLLGLAAAIGALLYVSKMYYDELQHGTETVQDARDAEAVKNDTNSKDEVLKQVSNTKGLSARDRYAVLKAAEAKLGELGDPDAAQPITEERHKLQRGALKGQDTASMVDAVSDEGKAAISAIRAQSATNKAARLSAVKYLPDAPQQGAGPSLQDLQTGAWIKAPKVQADPASPVAANGMSGVMAVGTAEAELRSRQPADVQRAQGSVDSLTAEIQALQDKKRAVGKDEKAAIQESIIQKQRQLGAARRELSAQKKLAGEQEREAKSAERAAGKKVALDEKDARMLDKIDSDAAYEDKIIDLEEQLDKAREDVDAKKVRALTLQIARLKAEAQFNEDIIAARDEEDSGHKSALQLAAKKKRDIAFNRAARDADKAAARIEREGGKATKKKLSPAEVNAIFRATGANMLENGMGFPALSPTGSAGAGNRFEGLAPSLWGRNVGGTMSQGIPSLSDFSGSQSRREMNQERTARVKSITKKNSRITTIKFEDLEVEDAGGYGDSEVD